MDIFTIKQWLFLLILANLLLTYLLYLVWTGIKRLMADNVQLALMIKQLGNRS